MGWDGMGWMGSMQCEVMGWGGEASRGVRRSVFGRDWRGGRRGCAAAGLDLRSVRGRGCMAANDGTADCGALNPPLVEMCELSSAAREAAARPPDRRPEKKVRAGKGGNVAGGVTGGVEADCGG